MSVISGLLLKISIAEIEGIDVDIMHAVEATYN
jgi:hypothetical protein